MRRPSFSDGGRTPERQLSFGGKSKPPSTYVDDALAAVRGIQDIFEFEETEGDKPNLKLVRMRARRLAGIKDEQGNNIPLHSRITTVGRGGVGVELFFRTHRYLIIIFFVLAAIGSISLADNVRVARANGLYGADSLLLGSIGPGGLRTVNSLIRNQGIPWIFIYSILIAFRRASGR
jgi:hypothetical protein